MASILWPLPTSLLLVFIENHSMKLHSDIFHNSSRSILLCLITSNKLLKEKKNNIHLFAIELENSQMFQRCEDYQ